MKRVSTDSEEEFDYLATSQIFNCHYLHLLTADIDREDVCDLVLTEETASDFEFAVDSQVCMNYALLATYYTLQTNISTLNVEYEIWRPLSLENLRFCLINLR